MAKNSQLVFYRGNQFDFVEISNPGNNLFPCYHVLQGVPYSSVPRRNKPRRVDLYYSSWCIRAGNTLTANISIMKHDHICFAFFCCLRSRQHFPLGSQPTDKN